MQVEIKIDSSYTDPKIIILTASMTDEVSSIVKKLSENVSQIVPVKLKSKLLTFFKNKSIIILN